MRLILLLFVLLFFQSCMVFHDYPNRRVNSLTELSFLPNDNKVDIFFTGETEPEKDYIRIAVVKQTITGNQIPPGRLLKSLELRAKQAGGDGLIVMGMSETGNTFEDVARDVAETVPRNHMWGIAIRYTENLEEGLNMLSYVTVETKGEIAEMEGGRIEATTNGDFYRAPEGKWATYVYQHSLEYLVHQRPGWAVANRSVRSGFWRTHIRRNGRGNNIQAKVELNYLRPGKLGTLRISYLDGLVAETNMTIRYDDQGRIAGREWVDNTRQRFVTERQYDSNGLLLAESYQRQRSGEALLPLLTVNYHYLSDEEIQQRLGQEQIVRVTE